MQESPHEREGIDNKHFRVLTGLVGLVVFLYMAVELVKILPFILPVQSIPPIMWIFIVTPRAGWAGLVYACWIRSGRITDTALAFVLVVGVLGMSISVLALVGGPRLPPSGVPVAIVYLTGTWILNGLGIVWVVHKVRRIRAASNTDEADAAR